MRKHPGTVLTVAAAALALLLSVDGHAQGQAQEQKKSQATKPESAQQEPKPLSEGLPQRELSKKERERREKKLREELGEHLKKWLEEDVGYILMDE